MTKQSAHSPPSPVPPPQENETKHNAALNEERQKKETEETVTPTDDVMTPPGGSKDTSLSGEKPSPITSSSSENGAGSPDSDSQPATTLCPHAGKGVELKAGKIPKVSSIPVRGAGRMFQHDAGKGEIKGILCHYVHCQ